jgi:hypothetical protein
VTALVMRGLAALFRVAAGLCDGLSNALVHLYDFAIMIPLRVEDLVVRRGRARAEEAG